MSVSANPSIRATRTMVRMPNNPFARFSTSGPSLNGITHGHDVLSLVSTMVAH